MDRFDLVLWDLRNHGWNPVGERRRHNMPTFASDSRTIADATDIHFGAKPRIGVFHSVAGIAALLHQVEDADGYAGLVLLDPPICHLGKTVEELLEIGDAMAERTRQRRRLFDSWRGIHQFRRALPDVSAHSKRDAGSVGPNHAARVAVGRI